MDQGHGRTAGPGEGDSSGAGDGLGERMPKHRMLALTDGVVAIAMTLLVLDVELPDGLEGRQLRDALDDVWSQIGAFLLSAVVIAMFWRAHHTALRGVEWLDARLFWLNVGFLALISLIPFPTRVLEGYADRPLGPALYGVVIGLAALLVYAQERHVVRRLAPEGARPLTWPVQALVFLASVGIAWYSPRAAMCSWLAAVPLSLLSHRRADRRADA
ncbi:TMEM175 family protein [Streptomyces sp. NPDC015131]|uniref:TMEM175 family protein n=1 Tax=Streptomyces sp. NPDC015131 TaxID=3364941 RepID=UPI0036F8BA68